MVKQMSAFLLIATGFLLFSFSVIAQPCTPNFGAVQSETVTIGGARSALVDFDDDGKSDLIMVDENGVPSIRFRTANGFSDPVVSDYMPSIYHPTAITVGYFDGDYIEGQFVANPYPDVAVATSEGGVYLLTSDPYGYFSFRGTPVLQGMYAALAAVDFNEDGMSDLMAVDVNGGSLMLLSQGDGNWGEIANSAYTASAFANGELPIAAASGYFDGEMIEGSFLTNGSPDLAVLSNQGRVFLFTTDPYGYFSVREMYFGTAIVDLQAADVNGDGRTDLLVKDSSGMLSILIRNVNGEFDAPHAIGEDLIVSLIGAGDMNGDGNPDIVVTMSADTHVAWFGSESTCQPAT